MQAVRLYGIGDLRVEEIDEPGDPADSGIVVAVEAAGICGSDLHNYKTGMWLSRIPSVPGHEFCGRVVAIGCGAKALSVGDRIIADSRVFCGSCDMCLAGRSNLCRSIGYVGEVIDGGFAPLVKLEQNQVLRLHDQQLDPQVAAMAEPLAVALHAVARLSPREGEPIVVTGAGPIGAISTIVLAHRGFGPLFVVDRNESRRTLVTRLTGAKAATLDDFARGTPFVVETTGSANVLAAVLDRLNPGGRIASVGIFHERGSLDLNRIVEGEIDLVGCAAFKDELAEANLLLAELAPQLTQLAGRPIALSDVPAAYERLGRGEAASVKTIIMPSAQ
jgi:(R,R)-butanediol dehydrogenase/meso-butanediol dehydrogenase/diacetyl reductase